jgi:predicted metal-dependent TIM-barrel fold hydrolase
VKYIEPHAHMVSRTTDDYEKLALAGCAAICEPAFWAGFDRSSPQGFYDYYRQLTDYEPKRAAKFGIPHFCWLCINPKEAEDAGFAREVMAILPEFLAKPTVLGIGEIGLNKNTRNELAIFEEHVQIALDHDLPVLIHTPHLEDKLKGTRLILDALASFSQLDRGKVIIDHVEEHTAGLVLDQGYWAGMTLYPESKCTPNRAIDILELFGTERLWLNSACDWGVSDPLAVAKCGLEMRKRKYSAEEIEQVLFENPKTFLSQSRNFKL